MKWRIKQSDYVRYEEGAERYSMCKNSFMKLAHGMAILNKTEKS